MTDGTWTYTWEHGRQLASMSDGSTTWSYTYDANGMRTGRTDGTTTYSYVYNGSQLVQMVYAYNSTAATFNFYYDASGAPLSVNINGADYYYVTNLQGDIVAILNASGTKVASYEYDAWGKLTDSEIIPASTTDVYLAFNPLRYRGYVFDLDTGLYYLQSRYYNPEIGRFINADAFASTGQGILGNNMFAYCGNDPVNRYDLSGHAYAEIRPVYWGQGEYSELPTRLTIPNARRVESWQEVAEVTVDYIGDIISSDPVQDGIGAVKAGSGVSQMSRGFAVLLVPDFIPLIDEAIAVWDVLYGFYKFATGIGETTDWEEVH